MQVSLKICLLFRQGCCYALFWIRYQCFISVVCLSICSCTESWRIANIWYDIFFQCYSKRFAQSAVPCSVEDLCSKPFYRILHNFEAFRTHGASFGVLEHKSSTEHSPADCAKRFEQNWVQRNMHTINIARDVQNWAQRSKLGELPNWAQRLRLGALKIGRNSKNWVRPNVKRCAQF